MTNGRGLKLHNEYASEFSAYSEIPKAVFAAVAFSFAMRLNGDDMHNAIGAFYREWRTLHENGIIPQAPPRLPTIDPRDEEEAVFDRAAAEQRPAYVGPDHEYGPHSSGGKG